MAVVCLLLQYTVKRLLALTFYQTVIPYYLRHTQVEGQVLSSGPETAQRVLLEDRELAYKKGRRSRRRRRLLQISTQDRMTRHERTRYSG